MYENKNKQIAAGYYIAIIDNSVKLVCQHKGLLWPVGGECGGGQFTEAQRDDRQEEQLGDSVSLQGG